MTPRTRYFLLGSGLVVAIGLGTGLVAYYGEPGSRAVPSSDFAYIPAGVTAVGYADLRHIVHSEFHQRLRAMMPSGHEKARLLEDTGIDLERDIDSIVAGLDPASAGGGPVVLVRGRFNEDHIESVAAQHGATVEQFRGKRLLTSLHPAGTAGPAGDEPAVAFLEPGLVGLGQLTALKRAIEGAERHESIAANTAVMSVVQDVADDGDAWLVGRLDAMPARAGLPGAMRAQLDGVQWFSLTAAIDQAMNCRLRAETRDAEAGESLRSVVNGALAIARVMAGSDQRLDSVLQSVQARGTGSNLDVSFTVPPEALDALRSGVAAAQPNLGGRR
ncbi:MAG: hypothetical protein IT184_10620 [Acidobacteria bacterium]|nr:hypothetical protein [Acidobacteriota bacterium]